MLYYDHIDVSEVMVVSSKTNDSREYKLWNYNYFFHVNFSLHQFLWIGVHNLLEKVINVN